MISMWRTFSWQLIEHYDFDGNFEISCHAMVENRTPDSRLGSSTSAPVTIDECNNTAKNNCMTCS